MKISELASRSDTPLSAVKYYQREGLLPQGKKTAPNQTDYSKEHVQRVRLIRALLGAGGLTIAATKQVIWILDHAPLAEAFEAVQSAMSTSRPNDADPSPESRERIMELARSQGWAFTEANPGINAAARALDGLATGGFTAPRGYLESYAAAAATAANADLQQLRKLSAPEQITERMVVGTVLGDPLFAGLRRIAQQDATQESFPQTWEVPSQ